MTKMTLKSLKNLLISFDRSLLTEMLGVLLNQPYVE